MAEQKITKDLSGTKVGRLQIISFAENRSYYMCQCECGKVVRVTAGNIRRGTTKSCGCLRRDLMREARTKHGMETSREYNSWQLAKDRCFNPRARRYDRYGARGITMCEEWKNDFAKFLSHMGKCPAGYLLDRINNDGNYEPGNCRWTDRITQNRNQSRSIFITHQGETLHLKEWAKKLGVAYLTLYSRYRRTGSIF